MGVIVPAKYPLSFWTIATDVETRHLAHKSPLLRFPVWGSMFPCRVYKTRLERTQIVLDIFRGYLFAGEDFLTYFCSTGKSSRLLKI